MRDTVDHGGQPIRVLLGFVPGILASILEDAARQWPDVAFVGEAKTEVELERALGVGDPDVLVLGLGGGESLRARESLLQERPRLRILGIAADGRQVTVLELRPHFSVVGNLSPSDLMQTIRAGAR